MAKRAVERGQRVLILVHRQELLSQASTSLLRLDAEHGLIARGYFGERSPLVVASIQTLDRRLKQTSFAFDFVIIDEAHHVGASTWNRVMAHFPRARVLGVTATPIRLDGKGLGRSAGGIFDDMIVGPSIDTLIINGALVRPEVFAPPTEIDLSSVKKKSNGDYDPNSVASVVNKASITGNAVEHYSKLCRGEPTLVFCANLQHAQAVCDEFNSAGFRFRVIHGKLSDHERKTMISELGNGEINGLVSVDLISEGTDIPVVSTGILLRPTNSLGLYLQQVGRILRPAPSKTRALILDHVGNCLKHGLPDDDREWSLDGVKKSSNSDGRIIVKQCKSCFAVFDKIGACPYCGHRNIKETRVIEQNEGELRRISREEARRAREEREALTRTKMDRYKSAGSWEDLTKIGAEYGDSMFFLKKRWGRKFGKHI